MAIPQSFIDELLERIDVAEVVGRYVQLKKSGANFMGLCPFHDEKSPSFSVSPSKQFYHCFGCGKSGNAIGFLMDYAGEGFIDAIHTLAQQAGMQVPQENISQSQIAEREQSKLERKSLTQLNATAVKAYKKNLKESPHVIDYLKKRGLTGVIAARFQLGYAGTGEHALASVFPDYADPLLEEAGLVIYHPESNKRYDRFRDRLMFPILNIKGECIGLGGRIIGKGQPKYLNSPETPVFHKSTELYGLFEAKQAIRQKDYAIVCEGYMDVVALAQWGFENSVATLGTACSERHIQILFRHTDSIVFAFDGDKAGKNAAAKALRCALPAVKDTRSIRFLFLPAEHDPDSYIREEGTAAFQAKIDSAMTLSSFLLQQASIGCNLATPEGRARMAEQAKPLYNALPPCAFKVQIRNELARIAQMQSEDLLALWQVDEHLMPSSSGKPHNNLTWSAASAEWQNSSAPDWDAYEDDFEDEFRALATPHIGNKPRNEKKALHGNSRYLQRKDNASYYARNASSTSLRKRPLRNEEHALCIALAHMEYLTQLTHSEMELLRQLERPDGLIFAWLDDYYQLHGATPWEKLKEKIPPQQLESLTRLQKHIQDIASQPANHYSSEFKSTLRGILKKQLQQKIQHISQQCDNNPTALQQLRALHMQLAALK